MKTPSGSQVIITVATIGFIAWTLLNTVFWPIEDYGNVVHAYAESTNQIVRGMSLGFAGYISVVGLVIGLKLTSDRKKQAQFPGN